MSISIGTTSVFGRNNRGSGGVLMGTDGGGGGGGRTLDWEPGGVIRGKGGTNGSTRVCGRAGVNTGSRGILRGSRGDTFCSILWVASTSNSIALNDTSLIASLSVRAAFSHNSVYELVPLLFPYNGVFDCLESLLASFLTESETNQSSNFPTRKQKSKRFVLRCSPLALLIRQTLETVVLVLGSLYGFSL